MREKPTLRLVGSVYGEESKVTGIQSFYMPLGPQPGLPAPLNQINMNLIHHRPYNGGFNSPYMQPQQNFQNPYGMNGGMGGFNRSPFGFNQGAPSMFPPINFPPMGQIPPMFPPYIPQGGHTSGSNGFQFEEDEFANGWNESFSLSQYSTVMGKASKGDSKTSKGDLEDYKAYITNKAENGQLNAIDAKAVLKIINHAINNFDELTDGNYITKQSLTETAKRDGNGSNISYDDVDPDFVPSAANRTDNSKVFKINEIEDLFNLDADDDDDLEIEFSREDLRDIAVDLERELEELYEDGDVDQEEVNEIERKLQILEFLMVKNNYNTIANADEFGTVYESSGDFASQEKITLGEIIKVSTTSTREVDRFGMAQGDINAFRSELRDRFDVPERPEKFHIDLLSDFGEFKATELETEFNHYWEPARLRESVEKMKEEIYTMLPDVDDQEEYDQLNQYIYLLDLISDNAETILDRMNKAHVGRWNTKYPENTVQDVREIASVWRNTELNIGFEFLGIDADGNSRSRGNGSWEDEIWDTKAEQGDDFFYIGEEDFS